MKITKILNTCTCKQQTKRAKNKRRKMKKQAKEFEEHARTAARRVRENQNNYYLELWATQSGLKFETLRDLMGLEFN